MIKTSDQTPTQTLSASASKSVLVLSSPSRSIEATNTAQASNQQIQTALPTRIVNSVRVTISAQSTALGPQITLVSTNNVFVPTSSTSAPSNQLIDITNVQASLYV
jgi:hypothetical protein